MYLIYSYRKKNNAWYPKDSHFHVRSLSILGAFSSCGPSLNIFKFRYKEDSCSKKVTARALLRRATLLRLKTLWASMGSPSQQPTSLQRTRLFRRARLPCHFTIRPSYQVVELFHHQVLQLHGSSWVWIHQPCRHLHRLHRSSWAVAWCGTSTHPRPTCRRSRARPECRWRSGGTSNTLRRPGSQLEKNHEIGVWLGVEKTRD